MAIMLEGEVINGSILEVGTLCSQLMNEMLQVLLHMRATGNPHEPVESERAISITRWLGMWRRTAQSFEWHHVESAIDRLAGALKKGARYSDLDYGLHAINDAVHDGLKNQLIYRYSNEKAAAFKRWKSDWAPVIARFPEAAEDMRASTDLWALGHHTASVFHVMRVLEQGLRALATQLAIPYEAQNWQNIIEQIESSIRQAQKTLPKGEPRNATLQYLSEIAKEFMYFKDGWRNYVAHSKGTYTEQQARSVLEHGRQFMVSLVSRVKDRPSEIP